MKVNIKEDKNGTCTIQLDWKYLFHIQYEHEGVKISLSMHESQTSQMYNGIDQRKLHYRISCRLDSAGD